MPRIEIEISDKVMALWREFEGTMQADGLRESGLLGDWLVQGFLANLHIYIAEGGPHAAESRKRRTDRKDAEARRNLPKEQRRVLPMFNENDRVTVAEISRVLGVPEEQGRTLVDGWIAQGFLTNAGLRDGQNSYTLAEDWQVRNLAANRPSLNAPRSVFKPVVLSGD